MTLTDQQIFELFRFCEKKFVRYYDLQVELVDHLAERIEEEMTANSRLSFDEALAKVYAGFGLFGFAHIVREKTETLYKQRNREWWRAAKRFFTVPKLVQTLALFWLLVALGKFIPNDVKSGLPYILWTGAYFHLAWRCNRLRKRVAKPLLLTEADGLPVLLSPVFAYWFLDLPLNNSPWGLAGFALLCVAAWVMHGATTAVNNRVHAKALALYPDAFKAAS